MKKVVLGTVVVLLSSNLHAMNRRCLQKMDDLNSKIDTMQIKMDLLLANTCPQEPTPTPIPNRPVYNSQNMQVGEPDRMFITNKLPLYIGVVNTLTVNFPEIAKRNLTTTASYTVTSGTIQSSSAKEIKVLVSNRGLQIGANLKVNNQNNIEEYSTNVVQMVASLPPKPRLGLQINGAEFNGMAPVNRRSQFTIKVTPDSDFARLFITEANYKINSVQVFVQKNLGAPTLVNTINTSNSNPVQGINLNLTGELDNEAPGTKVLFKIDQVSRINSKGEEVEESFSELDLTTGFIIK